MDTAVQSISIEVAGVQRFLSLITRGASCFELRVIRGDRQIMSGVFNNLDDAIAELEEHSEGRNCYVLLNPIDEEANNQLAPVGNGGAINDDQVTGRRWFFVDIDPVRLSGTAATDQQRDAARNIAGHVRRSLTNIGWSDPMQIDSGNGVALYYAVDLPNDPESAKLVRAALGALDELCSTDRAKIDVAVGNAARIGRIAGTLNLKGKPEEWRLAQIIDVPPHLEGGARQVNGPKRLQDLIDVAALEHGNKSGVKPGDNPERDKAVFLAALEHLPDEWRDDYERWFSLIPVAKQVGALDAFDVWSKKSSKYKPGEVYEKAKTLRDDHPNPIGLGTVIWAANEATGGKFKAETLAAIDERFGKTRTYPMTDLGNAERLVDLHRSDIINVPNIGPMLWDGKIYVRDELKAVRNLGKRTARAIMAEAQGIEEVTDRRTQLIKHALKSEQAKSIRDMVDLALTDPRIAAQVDDLDQNPFLLNCQNGVLNLKTGRLHEHHQRFRMTRIATADYCPGLRSSTFEQFLQTTFQHDSGLISFVQKVFGSALIGRVYEHILPVLVGTGRNGKTTLIEAVAYALGSYAQSAAPDLLIETRHSNHPTERADLRGARLVTSVESPEGAQLNETLIKQLTGGDRVKARFMKQDFFEFTPTWLIVLSTNHKPMVRGNDLGIWRRIKIIPFNYVIPPEKVDKTLPEKLRDDADAVLAWLVQGSQAFIANKFDLQEPESVQLATEDYRDSQDTFADFLRDMCESGDYEVSAQKLRQAYVRWCTEVGQRPMDLKRFSHALIDRGFKKFKRSTVFYSGLRLICNPLEIGNEN